MDETPTELSDFTLRSSDPGWKSLGSTSQGSHTRGVSDGPKHKQSSSFGRGHNRSGSAKQSISAPSPYSPRSPPPAGARPPPPGVPNSPLLPRTIPYSPTGVIVIGSPDARESRDSL